MLLLFLQKCLLVSTAATKETAAICSFICSFQNLGTQRGTVVEKLCPPLLLSPGEVLTCFQNDIEDGSRQDC